MDYLPELLAFSQIVLIDLTMAGDNAIVIGMAAASLPRDKRKKAVMAGVLGATVLRILFAVFAVKLLKITGLTVAGGLLLLWVSWKMYRELRHIDKVPDETDTTSEKAASKTLSGAIWQIIVADVSMSLDNVLGVAGVARDHLPMLVAGLTLSIVLMGVASAYISRMVAKYNWIGYLGLAVILFTAIKMIWDGAHQLAPNLPAL